MFPTVSDMTTTLTWIIPKLHVHVSYYWVSFKKNRNVCKMKSGKKVIIQSMCLHIKTVLDYYSD